MFRHDISTRPNPPMEGQTLIITVPHSGPWYVSLDGSGRSQELRANERGELELPSPPGRGGETFTVTDYRDPPTDGNFEITSQDT